VWERFCCVTFITYPSLPWSPSLPRYIAEKPSTPLSLTVTLYHVTIEAVIRLPEKDTRNSWARSIEGSLSLCRKFFMRIKRHFLNREREIILSNWLSNVFFCVNIRHQAYPVSFTHSPITFTLPSVSVRDWEAKDKLSDFHHHITTTSLVDDIFERWSDSQIWLHRSSTSKKFPFTLIEPIPQICHNTHLGRCFLNMLKKCSCQGKLPTWSDDEEK